jgi:cytoskeleton protein RodZ
MEATVGQQLKKAREALGIRIEDAAQATHIKLAYLLELENDHPELLPSPVNARGFLRLYSSLLKIPSQPLIELWEHPTPPEPEPAPLVENMEEEPVQFQEIDKPVPEEVILSVVEMQDEEVLENQSEVTTPTATLPEQQLSVDEIKPVKKKRGRKKLVNPMVEEDLSTENKPEQVSEAFKDHTAEKEIEKSVLQPEIAVNSEIAQVPQSSSAELFIEIGAILRQRRETLQLNLADIERFTHIKRSYLEALEGGRFSQLPSSVQGRGMLNNYVSFLNMDEETVMSLYAAALEEQRQERLPPRKPEPILTGRIRFNIPEPLKKYINPDLLFGSVIILALFIFLLWGAVQVFTQQNLKATPQAPSISEVLQTTPTILVTPDPTLTAQVTANPAGTLVPGSGNVLAPAAVTPLATKNTAPLQLYIVALQRAYLKMTVDGKLAFDGRVQPGSVYTYSGITSIELLTGSAASLEVYFNQEFLGKLGDVGQVIKLSFNEKGLTTPVSTLFPQSTPTSITNNTPQATPTVK